MNKDGLQASPDEITEISLPTAEVADNYIRVKIQLPIGTSDAQGRVNKCARDNLKNILGHANEEPALNTRTHVVEFEHEEEASLSANTITPSMYAQCDPDGNKYP